MKTPSSIFLAIILVAIGFAAYVWWPSLRKASNTVDDTTPITKLMSIETYVTQNISMLSLEKEVLGGKFYVTDITATEGKGVVSYEDGHNAFTADFVYTSSDRTGYTITSFIIRK